MTNIRASRKGTRLNEARHFRLPTPHARKKMILIRVISPKRVSDSGYFHAVQDLSPNPEFKIPTKAREHGKIVEWKQSSVEIEFAMDDKSEDRNKKIHQEICVGTEVVESSNDIRFSIPNDDISSTIQNLSEQSVKCLKAENNYYKIAQEIVHNEIMQTKELHNNREHSCSRSIDQKQSCGDQLVEKEEKCSSWWKDSGQTILQFFAKILGKRTGMAAKGPADCVLSTSKQHDKRVKRVSRGSKRHNRNGKGIDGGMRLKRVRNGYTANLRYRDESRHGVAENKLREEHPSILVRQIQRTRDKNLRVMLLERELHTRCFGSSQCSAMIGAFSLRQSSSPLC